MDALLLTHAISGSVVRAISFGLYSASFIHCVRCLLFEDEGWRVRKKVNRTLVITTLLIFFLSTGLLCAGWMKRFGASGRLRPVIWSLDILECSGIQCSILIVIDGVLIHRCWTVSSKNWRIIIFPLFLWCFCLVCGVVSFYCNLLFLFLFLSGLNSQNLALQKCVGMSYDSVIPLAFYVCNIVINIYTTTVLVYTIWCAVKNIVGTNRLYKLCRILTESGILYTLSSIVYLISWIRNYSTVPKHTVEYILSTEPFLSQPFAVQIAMDITMFVPGIAFNLIIIRVGEQRVEEEDNWVDSKDANNVPMPSELLDTRHCNPQSGEIDGSWQEGHERTDEEKVMASNGTKVGDIMEADGGSLTTIVRAADGN